MTPAEIEIKGDADLKIELFGKVYYDHDTPFDMKFPLTAEASQTFNAGPAEITVGISGETVSVAVAIDGFPVFTKGFTPGATSEPFDVKFLGDTVKGSVNLIHAA